MRIDNDATKGLAVPFVILAHVRTGGTFAAHALSNHPEIYCDRGETLHHLSAWRQAKVPVGQILATIWHQDGYHAAGFRAIYRQAFHAEVWPRILRARPRIVHITRRNVARQGVSFAYHQLVRRGELPFHPVHSFEERAPEPVEADPEAIARLAVKVRSEMDAAAQRLAGYPGQILTITYEDMVGHCPADEMRFAVAVEVEDFLGVRRARLPVDLKRDIDLPIADWFTNWPEIRRALKRAGFVGGWD